MNPIVHKAQQSQIRKDHPNFRPGDTVKINVRLKEGEGDKERIQPFEGVVMSRRGELLGESFTVRRVSFGIGVERIFPVHSPMISSIEIVQARGAGRGLKRRRKQQRPSQSRFRYGFELARSEKSGRAFLFFPFQAARAMCRGILYPMRTLYNEIAMRIPGGYVVGIVVVLLISNV